MIFHFLIVQVHFDLENGRHEYFENMNNLTLKSSLLGDSAPISKLVAHLQTIGVFCEILIVKLITLTPAP